MRCSLIDGAGIAFRALTTPDRHFAFFFPSQIRLDFAILYGKPKTDVPALNWWGPQ
jgi:hypothetical protein